MEKKKSKKKKWIIIGIIVAVIIVAIVVANVLGGGQNAGMPVTVVDATENDIKQVIDISGTVTSEEEKTYFAETSAKINELNVSDGGSVEKGASLVVYDTEELESALNKAQLEAKSSELGADAVVIGLNNAQKKASEAATNYDEAVKYVQHYTDCVNQLNSQLSEVNSLQEKKTNLETEIAGLQAELEKKPDSDKIPGKIEKKTKELKSVNKKLSGYNISDLQSALEKCSSDLAEYKALEAEYKATKETADPSAQKQKEQQAVVKEVAQLSAKDLEKELALAKEGVSAEVSGIVSDVQVVAGQTVQAGAPLFKIADSSKVKVTVQLTKYNLENISIGQKAELTINGKKYTGEVSYVNKVATKNETGATVVQADIHIDAPDDNIFLGVEAQVSIEVANKEGVLSVPLACVNYGADSTFCYVVEDGVVAKKEVETGISSAEYIEIVSGLEPGDQVIDAMGTEYEEGMPVTPITPTTEE